MPVFTEKNCILCLAPSPMWGLTDKIIKTAQLIRGSQNFHFAGMSEICAKQYFAFLPKSRWSDSLNSYSHAPNANKPTFVSTENQDTEGIKDQWITGCRTREKNYLADSAFVAVVGVNSRLLPALGFGRSYWESQGPMLQQNLGIYPCVKHSLIASRTLFTISSYSLFLNYRFKQHHILSLIPWPGTKIPYVSEDRGVFRAWASSRLCSTEEMFNLPSLSPFLMSHPDTWVGYNKLQLNNFVVEVDLYLAALMKSFDVLLRYTASFLAFCLPCLL